MPLFRENNFLVVHPGSEYTIFSFGLQDSLAPPQFKIRSVVYRDPNTKELKSKNSADNDFEEVYPVEKSKIVDLDAFNYLLKVILQSVINDNPIVTINQIPLLIVVPSLTWSRHQVEVITKYVFESLELTAFNIVDLSIAASFGIGNSASSLVINVGHQSCQVSPVIGHRSISYATKHLSDFGGITIDREIQKLLPQLSSNQIEALKTSGIFEVINEQEGSFYNLADLNNEGNEDETFDVAKLVTSENVEQLEKTIREEGIAKSEDEEKKDEEEEGEAKPNKELEKNYFIDPDTQEKIYVGKERFQGTSSLINGLSDAIYESLLLISDMEKRQECYDNLIFVGSTFKIPGLKNALLLKLVTDYLVHPPSQQETGKKEVTSTIAAYQRADESNEPNGDATFVLSQVPSSIRSAKYPEYFPEWKKPKERGGSWEDIYFLGAEIYAKQVFGGNSNQGGELFVDTDVYEERGPQAIWDAVI